MYLNKFREFAFYTPKKSFVLFQYENLSIKKDAITQSEHDYLLESFTPVSAQETLSMPASITYNNITWKYVHLESADRSDTQ